MTSVCQTLGEMLCLTQDLIACCHLFICIVISCARSTYLRLTKEKLRFKKEKSLVPCHRARKYKVRIHTQVSLLPIATQALRQQA